MVMVKTERKHFGKLHEKFNHNSNYRTLLSLPARIKNQTLLAVTRYSRSPCLSRPPRSLGAMLRDTDYTKQQEEGEKRREGRARQGRG